MEEVIPGIFLIKEKSGFERIKPSENIYIIAGPDGLIFDAGFGNKKVIKFLIKEINKIEQKYRDSLSFIAKPDEIIKDNTEISINGETWKVFPSPGHAIDHISLYNEEKGVLLSGDNVLSKTTWLGPPNCNIGDYIESIETIQKLPNLKIILAAHGALINNPRERTIEILEHRKERTQQVLDIVKEFTENGTSPDEIIQKLYSNKKKMRTEIARGWVCLTLKMLEEQNVIKRIEGKKEIKFYTPNKL